MLFIYCSVICKFMMYIKHKCRQRFAQILPEIQYSGSRATHPSAQSKYVVAFFLNKSVEYENFSHSHSLSKPTAVPIRETLYW